MTALTAAAPITRFTIPQRSVCVHVYGFDRSYPALQDSRCFWLSQVTQASAWKAVSWLEWTVNTSPMLDHKSRPSMREQYDHAETRPKSHKRDTMKGAIWCLLCLNAFFRLYSTDNCLVQQSLDKVGLFLKAVWCSGVSLECWPVNINVLHDVHLLSLLLYHQQQDIMQQ